MVVTGSRLTVVINKTNLMRKTVRGCNEKKKREKEKMISCLRWLLPEFTASRFCPHGLELNDVPVTDGGWLLSSEFDDKTSFSYFQCLWCEKIVLKCLWCLNIVLGMWRTKRNLKSSLVCVTAQYPKMRSKPLQRFQRWTVLDYQRDV